MKITELNYIVSNQNDLTNEDLVAYDTDYAKFCLSKGILNAKLQDPTSSLEEARNNIDPVVRAWEFESEIRSGFPVIKFEFVPSIISDSNSVKISTVDGWCDQEELDIRLRYPPGPTIRVTSYMENMWNRYSRSKSGIGESLQSAMYYSLTVIEDKFGSRKKAAVALNVDLKILRKIGELSSTKGNSATARKVSAANSSLTLVEKKWLNITIRNVLLQLGYIAANLSPPPVKMEDLPNIQQTFME